MTKMKRGCKSFTHVIQMYHKKPYPSVVKNMLMQETRNNVVVNRA